MHVLRHNTKIACNFLPQLRIVGRSADPTSPTSCQKTGKNARRLCKRWMDKRGPSVQKPIEFITIKNGKCLATVRPKRRLASGDLKFSRSWDFDFITILTHSPAMYHSHFFSTHSFSYVRQTKLASSLVNFCAHYKIGYFSDPISRRDVYRPISTGFGRRHST